MDILGELTPGSMLFLKICLPTIILNAYFLFVGTIIGGYLSGESTALWSIMVLDVSFFLSHPTFLALLIFLCLFWLPFILLTMILVRTSDECIMARRNMSVLGDNEPSR